MISEADAFLLRRTFALAEEARMDGDFPYACILVDPFGQIVLEAKNRIHTEKNTLKHAEMVLLLEASAKYTFEDLSSFSVYASAEPCPMCAAAVYWSGVGRLVYGMSTRRKNDYNQDRGNISMNISCRDVIASGNRRMEVIGPLLEDEASRAHG